MIISMTPEKWGAFRSKLKTSIKDLERISVNGKSVVTDKNLVYKQLNSVLENVLQSRKIYIEAAVRHKLRLPVKEVIAFFDKICNQVQTLLETMEAGTATGDTILRIKKNATIMISSSYDTVKGQIKIVDKDKLEETASETKLLEASDSWKEQLENLKENIKDDKGLSKADKEKLREQIKKENIQNARKEAHSLFVKNKRYATRIPNSKYDENTVEIIEMPVIGIYKPFYFKNDFERAGIETDNVGFYLIVHDQVIVGLNLNELHEKGLMVKKYLMQVITSLSSKVGRRYLLVSDVPYRYKGYGFNFYWIMEERQLNKLTRNGEKRFQVLSWGFAL